ncbi:unnamed protein product [Rhodiola kirilowii]
MTTVRCLLAVAVTDAQSSCANVKNKIYKSATRDFTTG